MDPKQQQFKIKYKRRHGLPQKLLYSCIRSVVNGIKN